MTTTAGKGRFFPRHAGEKRFLRLNPLANGIRNAYFLF